MDTRHANIINTVQNEGKIACVTFCTELRVHCTYYFHFPVNVGIEQCGQHKINNQIDDNDGYFIEDDEDTNSSGEGENEGGPGSSGYDEQLLENDAAAASGI